MAGSYPRTVCVILGRYLENFDDIGKKSCLSSFSPGEIILSQTVSLGKTNSNHQMNNLLQGDFGLDCNLEGDPCCFTPLIPVEILMINASKPFECKGCIPTVCVLVFLRDLLCREEEYTYGSCFQSFVLYVTCDVTCMGNGWMLAFFVIRAI